MNIPLDRPAVSLCIPAYNQPELLRRCLQSVERQRFRNFEVIVTDDSTDTRTRELANEFSTRIPIVYEHHSPGLGSPRNWNRALDMAKGEFVIVLHQDDWLVHEGALEQFVSVLRSDTSVFFTFGMIEPEERDDIIARIPGWIGKLDQQPELLLANNIIGPPSNVMFRNSDYRFDPELMWVVDYELYFRWLKDGKRFVYIPEKLVAIGRHEEQITAYCDENPDIKLRENGLLFTKHKDRINLGVRLYDHYWRMLRNTALAVPPEKMEKIKKDLPQFMQRQFQQQQTLGVARLKNGLISKTAMFMSWLGSGRG